MPIEKLNRQLILINELHLILEQETTCLKEKSFSHLSEILKQKQQKLTLIAELDSVLSRPADLQQIENSTTAQEIKKEILSCLAKCQHINSINGKLVELGMRSNKHLTQLIKQATGKNSITYDQKGMLNSGQLLGKNIQA
ncbi:flagellar protein FlgN [Psychromonas sp. CNPT3]|uniref:flagellar protein FlgN n=1 Tax=Psychromonas sp. CNPT3 TaxID=314282 RepID=UPI00006E9916|nr:flagellar protein FlgN [Psychromonas sp. CNPT3]AGH80561.1 flagellar protein FlgN [Psychromonas sp. CNPT3]